VDKLRGCAKMVANMLERDNLPARKEAAQELMECVARIEAQVSVLKEKLKDTETKRKLAYKTLDRIEFYSDGMQVRRIPFESELEELKSQIRIEGD
jgi:hypothetical protein